MAMVSIHGMMEELIVVTGKTTTCMERASTNGLMGVSMKVTILMIKNKDMGYIRILMEDHTKETGTMASNMAKAYLLLHRVDRERVPGKKANECNGLMKMKNNNDIIFLNAFGSSN